MMKQGLRFVLIKKATIFFALLFCVAMVIVYFLTEKHMSHGLLTLSTQISSEIDKAWFETSGNKEHQRRTQCNEISPTMEGKCNVLEFFARVDASARSYDSKLVCNEASPNYDLVCLMYLKQIGLESQQSTICCLDNVDKVPKIVYYVSFGLYKLRLVHYISIKAASRFISPSAIYVVGDQHPTGKWWQKVLADVHGVRFLYREIPANISGFHANVKHISDIVRLQLLYMNGGIYLDTDEVVVRDLEPLLEYNLTMGMMNKNFSMGNAFIVAKRGNDFIEEWYSEYTKYNSSKYYWNSLQVPALMWKKNPNRVHLESDKIYRPNYFEEHLLFNESGFSWRDSYAVHVWSASSKFNISEHIEDFISANTTLAEIFRYVLFGDPTIRGIQGNVSSRSSLEILTK